MNVRKKLLKMTTPEGIAVYPWLTKADTRYDEDGVFKTTLRLDPRAASVTALLGELDEVAKQHKAELGLTKTQLKKYRMPYEPEMDDDGDETGNVLLKFKTKATYKDRATGELKPRSLRIFDAAGQPYTGGPIYGGSVLKIAFSPSGYQSGSNFGVTLYLNAVQVTHLVTSGGDASSYGFDVTDGFTNPSAEAAPEGEAEEDEEF